MRLKSENGCCVLLVGNLITMPVVCDTVQNESIIMVCRKRLDDETNKNKMENYEIVLNQDDTKRIHQAGYLGMALSILGDLRSTSKTEIIAKQINFIGFPSVSQFQEKPFDCPEMSYWYRWDGSLRKELTYIH